MTVASPRTARRLQRLRCLSLIAAVLVVAGGLAVVAARVADLWVNNTASMPEGLYRLTRLAGRTVARGTVVAVCPPSRVIAFATARRYLGPGRCPGNVEPLLKHVAAFAGDRVDVSEDGIRVNGTLLANSGRFAHDCAGRALQRIPAGSYTIAPHRVWLYAPVGRSWDSRYYGAVPDAGILGIAQPVLIFGIGNATCAS